MKNVSGTRTAMVGAMLAVLGVLARPGMVLPQDSAGEEPRVVTLDVQDTDLTEALGMIAKQTHWDVYQAAEVTGKVTLKADKMDGERVLGQMVEQCKGSWLRFYVLEKPSEQRPTRTAQKMLEFMVGEQRDRIQNMPEERRQQLFQRGLGPAFGAFPGGGAPGQAQPPAPGAPGAPPAGQAPDRFLVDPLRFLRLPETHDRISVALKNADFLAALDMFWDASGHPVMTEETVETKVTLEVKDTNLERALDQLCEPLNLKWYRAYLIAKPEELTREQIAQRMEQRWTQMWDAFWKQDPAVRQQQLQQWVDRLKGIPPDRLDRIRQSPWAPRIVERFTNFLTRLTDEQRREIAPLSKEVVRVLGGAQ